MWPWFVVGIVVWLLGIFPMHYLFAYVEYLGTREKVFGSKIYPHAPLEVSTSMMYEVFDHSHSSDSVVLEAFLWPIALPIAAISLCAVVAIAIGIVALIPLLIFLIVRAAT